MIFKIFRNAFLRVLEFLFVVTLSPWWQDPPVQLAIDHSSASEIEEDSDGAWSIVGGKV